MAFTDRYIQLPIQVYDKNLKELANVDDYEDSYMKVNPLEIESYRPTWDDADPKKNEIVRVGLRSGDSFLVYLTVSAFEELLNNHLK